MAQTMPKFNQKINFGAGPAAIPPEVVEQVQEALKNFDHTGLGILEISHRSKEFMALIKECEARLRELFSIPADYSVLFMHGGGSGQFAGIPMNMTASNEEIADYLIGGHWAKTAASEAGHFLKVVNAFPTVKEFSSIPDPSAWKLSDNSAYTYYCDNETVNGIEFPKVGQDYTTSPIPAALAHSKAPLIADMSSNMGSRSFDVSKFGMVFASAQKNLGIPGVCVVIVRNNLMDKARVATPSILSWKTTMKGGSLQNTPSVISVFVLREVLRWMAGKGGLDYFEDVSRKKAALVYDAVDASQGFYMTCVAPEYRSRMNVVFGVAGGDAIEKEFITKAEREHDMCYLGGHRAVGHMRASMYNAITVDDVRHLVNYMGKFQAEHC